MKPTMKLRIARTSRPLTIGIRREDPSRIWERRAPLTPEAVNHLVERQGVQVHVEGCERRVFKDSEYVKAGASIQPNLQAAHVVLGIKEPPLKELILSPLPSPVGRDSARTYVMFSHTAKGQVYNMPLLSAFLSGPGTHTNSDLLPTLIDYELLTSENDGKRTVGFGWFAGVAGVLESLSSMAHSHLELGVSSPFLFTPRPHTHPSLSSLRASLRAIGQQIAEQGTPQILGPCVVGLTGTGNVAQGCLSMLEELPVVDVKVEDLPALVQNPNTDLHKIYLVHAKASDYLVRSDGRYDRDDYYANPDKYTSVFAEKIAPYLTLLLNGAGWAPGYPRLMTNAQLEIALRKARDIGLARFTNVGDISCDPLGGLEFLTHASTLSDPYYKINVSSLLKSSSSASPSKHSPLPDVQMQAVDILPASIPLDASEHFSSGVMRYLGALMRRYTGSGASHNNSDDEAERALKRATIAEGGKLTEKHSWLGERVETYRAGASTTVASVEDSSVGQSHGTLRPKRILLLGSGMVAGPAVEWIAERKDVRLIVASNSRAELDGLRSSVAGSEKFRETDGEVDFRQVDVGDREVLSRLVGEADVVISLLPVPLHPTVAEICIQQKKHLVTASYISEDMRKLHDRALSSNVLLLNEIGLDPGIDHCSAISLIRNLQAQNKRITSFISFCGGLPAPDLLASTSTLYNKFGEYGSAGPLRYKFSWSPRGVLTAALNAARFKLRGQVHEVPGSKLLKSCFEDVGVDPRIALEGLPNRDSLPYVGMYGLGSVESMRTVLRGTLRYKGFSSLMSFFSTVGLLELGGTIQDLRSWHELVPRAQILRRELHPDADHLNLRSFPAYELDPEGDMNDLALSWLFSNDTGTPIVTANKGKLGKWQGLPPLPTSPMTPLDLFTLLLSHKLRYAPLERDMVVMAHEVIAETASKEEEVHTSSLIAYGDNRYSAMARTVGLPVAIAALAVVDGKVDVGLRGVRGPGDESVRNPVLNGLEEAGIGMKETKRIGAVGSLEKSLEKPESARVV